MLFSLVGGNCDLELFTLEPCVEGFRSTAASTKPGKISELYDRQCFDSAFYISNFKYVSVKIS